MKKYFILFVLLLTSWAQASTWFYKSISDGTQRDAEGEFSLQAKRFSDGTFKMQIVRYSHDHEGTHSRVTELNTIYANKEEFERAVGSGAVSDGTTTYNFKPIKMSKIQDKLNYTADDLKKEDISNYESEKDKIVSDYRRKLESDYSLREYEVEAKVGEMRDYLNDPKKVKPPEGMTPSQKILDSKERALQARGYFEATETPVTELFNDFKCFWVDEAGANAQPSAIETDSCGKKQKLCVGTIRCTGNVVNGRYHWNGLTGENSHVSGSEIAAQVQAQLVAKGGKKTGMKDNGKNLYFQTESGGVACKADSKNGCRDAYACLNETGAINFRKDKISDFNRKINDGTLNMNKNKGVQ